MGQAKRRGSFQQRRLEAMKKEQIEKVERAKKQEAMCIALRRSGKSRYVHLLATMAIMSETIY